MKKIAILLALLSVPVAAQVITGHGRKFGPGRILVQDICTNYRDGETNGVSGFDSNKSPFFGFASSVIIGTSGDRCKASALLFKTGAPAMRCKFQVYTDANPGPGALLAESTWFSATLIGSSTTTNSAPINVTGLVGGTRYYFAIVFDALGTLTDYVSVVRGLSTDSAERAYSSNDGTNWQFGFTGQRYEIWVYNSLP